MRDNEFKENEINYEMLNKVTLKSEIKFVVCFLIIFVFGVIPWLIGVNFMVRWAYKFIF